jgi:sulfite exporter TauE/SafE
VIATVFLPSFLAALGFGVTHCVGMCGGIAVSAGSYSAATPGARGRFLGAALYHAGKTSGYVFLGAIAGHVGALAVSAGPVRWIQGALSILAGLAIVAVGVEALGLARPFRFLERIPMARLFRPVAGAASRSRSSLAMGLVNGFLPCPVVYAFVAQAVARANAPEGALVMLALGLGTAPPLVALVTAGAALGPRLRAKLAPVAGSILVLFGAATIVRGVAPDAFHRAYMAAIGEGEHAEDCCAPDAAPPLSR